MKPLLIVLLGVTALSLVGCESDNENSDALSIVATTTYIGDMAQSIGGDAVEVQTLMGVGVDPHDYEPRQSDTRRLEAADVIIINGLNLEERMGDVIAQIDSAQLVVLGEHVDEDDLIYESHGTVDPHVWFDIDLWSQLTGVVGEALGEADPDNKAMYETRTEEYLQDLSMLDDYVRNRVDALDASDRILITAHDAFAYFGRAYGFEVHAVQGVSTDSEASVRDIEELAELLVELDVNSVFWESSVPQGTVDALVEAALDLDHDVSVGGELYSDSTGGFSQGHETYIRTFRSNVDTIVDALEE